MLLAHRCVQGLLVPKEWALEIKAGAVKEVRFGGSGPLPTNLQVGQWGTATDGPLAGCCWLGMVMQLPLQVVCAVPCCDETGSVSQALLSHDVALPRVLALLPHEACDCCPPVLACRSSLRCCRCWIQTTTPPSKPGAPSLPRCANNHAWEMKGVFTTNLHAALLGTLPPLPPRRGRPSPAT